MAAWCLEELADFVTSVTFPERKKGDPQVALFVALVARRFGR